MLLVYDRVIEAVTFVNSCVLLDRKDIGAVNRSSIKTPSTSCRLAGNFIGCFARPQCFEFERVLDCKFPACLFQLVKIGKLNAFCKSAFHLNQNCVTRRGVGVKKANRGGPCFLLSGLMAIFAIFKKTMAISAISANSVAIFGVFPSIILTRT